MPFSDEEKTVIIETLAEIRTAQKFIVGRFDRLPCQKHEDDIQENAISVEKSKWSMLIAVIAMLAALASVVGVAVTVSGKVGNGSTMPQVVPIPKVKIP